MISYSKFSTLKINGNLYPLLPYSSEQELLITDRVKRDPLGFTDIAETQGKYKTLLNQYNSDSIAYQSIIYEKLQVKIYSSEVINGILLKSGQPVSLVADTGLELLCKVQNFTPEKQGNTTFYLYTIDLIVFENDYINILHPYNSEIASGAVVQANKVTLTAEKIKVSQYFDDSCVTITGHTFTINFPELAAELLVGDSVTISSYDKRNAEGNGVTGEVIDITGGVITIDYTHTPGSFYPTSFEFEFNVDLAVDFYTLIQPKDKTIRAENEKIEIQGAVIPGKQSTFNAKEIVLFLSDTDSKTFLELYENSELKLTLSDDSEFVALFNPELEIITDENLINCNPIVLKIPYTNLVY